MKRAVGLCVMGAMGGLGCSPDAGRAATPTAVGPASRPFGEPRHMAQRYDVVEYFESGEPTLGRREHQLMLGRELYYFASADNRDRFVADPARYTPAYRGWCACGMAKGMRVEVTGRDFQVREGRLFLFGGAELKDEWLSDPGDFIDRAGTNWENLR